MGAPELIPPTTTASGTAPVGGTGTPNTIPRWTGASTLGDSIISQDNGTNRLLIAGGTAAAATNGTDITIQAQTGGTGNTNGGNILLLPGNRAGSGTRGIVRIDLGAGVDADLYLGNGAGPSTPYGVGQRVYSGQSHTALYANAGYASARASLGMVSGGVYTPALNVDPSGNVGIGTASPGARLDVLGSTSAGYFRFKGGNTNAGYGEFQNSSGTTLGAIGNGGGGALSGGTVSDLVLRAEANLLLAIGNNERARIDSAGNLILNTATTGATIQAAGSQQGLKLPATPGNTDPNTLDAYEDGGTAGTGGKTWTPVLKFGGVDITTLGGAYSSRVGRYTRVGNTIIAHVYIALTAKGTATGNASIDGLPTSSNTSGLYASGSVGWSVSVTFTNQIMAKINPNTTSILLANAAAGGGLSNITDANFANTSELMITISYPTT